MKDLDASLLRNLYEDKQFTTRQIAAKVGSTPRTIARRLHQFGIKPREPGPKRHLLLRSKEWLEHEYVVLKKPSTKIAKELGASPHVVIDWVKRHGLSSRKAGGSLKGKKMKAEGRKKMSAARRGKYTGESNPNWRGGYVDQTARERRSYPAKMWRDSVKERDGNKCRKCGATDRLHAHHIKAWRESPDLRYDIDNGLTLCAPCHEIEHGFRFPKWIMDR